jgi:Fe-S oxidoreductase
VNDFEDLCPGCGACKDVCPFLAEYGSPDLILRERPEAAFFCTSCRRCDGVCPQGLAPSAAFFEAKRRMVRQEAIALPVRKALNSARGFAKAGHRFPFSFYQDTDTVFWPGCGLAAHRPGLVRRVRNILVRRLNRRVGLALDCCFDPVYGLGDTDTACAALRAIGKRLRDHGVRQVITGCLNCHKLLSEHLEGLQVAFVLEVLPPEFFEKKRTGAIYLHHPCPSSRWEAIRNRATEAVNRVDPSLGTDGNSFPLAETSAAHCCGGGGGVSALNPDLADRLLDRITGEAANRAMVTYCTGCQNRFLKRGMDVVHLLECLPGMKPRRRIPSPLAQWANRFFLAMTERLKGGR